MCRYHVCFGSYLDVPRIHFTGNFRADVNSRNNDPCSFKRDYNNPNPNDDWNFNGTNEFTFVSTNITSVDYSSGTTEDEDQDPVLSAIIVNNLNSPFAKLTDLDVDVQDKSTIYGMKMGISWGLDANGHHNIAFMGRWTRAVIAQDVWPRMRCNRGSPAIGTQGTTILTDIEWINIKNSTALQQLKEAAESGSGKLSIRVSYYYFHGCQVLSCFTIGRVVGSIGVYDETETLNIGGERLMTSDNASPPSLTFDVTDSCYGVNASGQPWTYNTPFKLRDDNGNKKVVIDLSNGLPTNTDGTQRDIGDLYIGYADSTNGCLQIIEPNTPIPYMESYWLKSGAIATYSLTENENSHLLNNPLIVIQKIQGTDGEPLCGSLPSVSESGIVILQEREYFVRPYNYYIDRLEYQGGTSSKTLLVTKYGSPVSVQIKVTPRNPDIIPANGVTPDVAIKTSNSAGHVTFEFSVTRSIPYPRQYNSVDCPDHNTNTLPIDGQVYYFVYCVVLPGETDCTYSSNERVTELVFLAFSTIQYNTPYTWVDHVEPIFYQYADLSPVMKSIVDLSNYTAVTLPWNIELIKHSLLLDLEDANYMPTTRDLSPTKRAMIIEWLKNPIYSAENPTSSSEADSTTCSYPEVTDSIDLSATYFSPPRCLAEAIPHSSDPKDHDRHFKDIFKPTKKAKLRPLFGSKKLKGKGRRFSEICTLQSLKDQLQLAIQTEFYIIPVYLTSLYSIVDGCNSQTYDAIRGVVMQEMMHVAQAANILLSIGGNPVIDDSSFAPTYPHLGLPGGILPKLYVELKKLSLEQVYKVFMGIEVPTETWLGEDETQYAENTIGEFYDEVKACIDFLPDTIFDSATLKYQVTWPWDGSSYVGYLIKVDSPFKAKLAIDQIVIQGEGATPLHPNSSVFGEYAHFYRFEEIVCQNQLVFSESGNSYSYTGDPIPFDPQGVWPMRDNPKSSNIIANTHCYTEAVAFHHVYRSFLSKLDEVFTPCDGTECIDPQQLLMKSVEIMEALQVHAKKLMWVRYDPDNPDDIRTCGPVWDYNFFNITIN